MILIIKTIGIKKNPKKKEKTNKNNKSKINDIINKFPFQNLSNINSLTNKFSSNTNKNPLNNAKDNYLITNFAKREKRLRAFRRNDIQMRQLTLYSILFYDLFFKFNLLKEVLNRKNNYPNISLEIMKLMNKNESSNYK